MNDHSNDIVYVLDSYGLIYRSYFAFIKRPLVSPSGANVSAVYGFFRSLFNLFERERPRHFFAAFDSPVATFRHELYADYKATRQKTPEDLHAQVPVVIEALKAMGVPMANVNGYEADDIIATVARMCREEGRPMRVISGDKDLLQLVGGDIRVLQPDRALEWIDMGEREVAAAWGVEPDRILDYLSLTGDSSDNIPGVAGIGDKTACKLINEYGNLDRIYEKMASVKPDGVRKKLEAGRDSAYFSRKLVTLVDTVPLPYPSLESFSLDAFDRSKADGIFLSLGMKNLVASGRARPQSDGASGETGQQAESLAAFNANASGRASTASLESIPGLPKIPFSGTAEYSCCKDSGELRTFLGLARKAGILSFDCETSSLDEESARMIGFSLSTEQGRAMYVPLFSPDGPSVPQSEALEELKAVFGDPSMLIIGQNLKFDLRILMRRGITAKARLFDTMVAAWLVDASQPRFDLASLSLRVLDRSGLAFDEVVAKGSDFSSVGIEKATRYACEDADFAMGLYDALAPELDKRGLRSLFDDVEMPLVPILARMESVGIAMDSSALGAFGKELETRIEETRKKVYGLCGHEFNLNSTKQLQQVLFEERKLRPVKTTRSGYSTDESVLSELAREDPVAELLLEYRGMTKLLGTYVQGLMAIASGDGTVRTHYMQTGTETGRLSSRDPNMQNIPVRNEEGRKIRAAFVARPGAKLVSADYSQIELVVLAHLSGDPGLGKAFADGIDVHSRTASLLFKVDEPSPAQRRTAKAINFGVIYGMSAFRLANDLGIGRKEAQAFIDAYFATYSGVRDFIARTVAEVEAKGYATTILGRQRPVPDLRSRNKNEHQAGERVAVNTVIQGSAADIVKLAMVRVQAALERDCPEARLLLQVHDELIVEAPEKKAEAAAKIVREEMEKAYKLSVPLRASVEIAKRWGDMH